MSEPRGQDLVKRYKANYSIPVDAVITEEQILEHWELEKRLTRALLASTPANRWEVFERCYSELYAELHWLNRLPRPIADAAEPVALAEWRQLIGQPPQRIYEVGSGKGQLIRWLAASGYDCKGSEITRERGKKWTEPNRNLSWGVSDGVHLDWFEPAEHYDAVLSKQLIEHLHPADVLDHCKAAHTILKRGGRYLVSTPHALTGPWDISRVFRQNEPMGMHLKEYTYDEIVSVLKHAGFARAEAVLRMPMKVCRRLGMPIKASSSVFFTAYLKVAERVLESLPSQPMRRRATTVARLVGFEPEIMVVATK